MCDFDTYLEIVYGGINQMKKIGLMALEFPELYDRLEYLVFYLKSKQTNFIHFVKDSYKNNLTYFESKNSKFSFQDALEQVATFDLVGSILPELRKHLVEDIEANIKEGLYLGREYAKKLPDFSKSLDAISSSRSSPFMPINPLKRVASNPYEHASKGKRPFKWNPVRKYSTVTKCDILHLEINNLI